MFWQSSNYFFADLPSILKRPAKTLKESTIASKFLLSKSFFNFFLFQLHYSMPNLMLNLLKIVKISKLQWKRVFFLDFWLDCDFERSEISIAFDVMVFVGWMLLFFELRRWKQHLYCFLLINWEFVDDWSSVCSGL
jgi:hypothetical protein